MSFYKEQLNRWLMHIDVDADSVLDVGGGELPVKGRVASWKVKNYLILDHDAQFKPDLFADMNYSLNGQLPVRQWLERFDIVFCLEVAEYIWDTRAFHENIFALLKDKGIAYLSYPMIYPLHNPPKIDFLRYTKNAIEKLLGETGFTTWEITPRIATEGIKALSDFYLAEGMHPLKNTDEIFNIGYLAKCYKGGE